MEQEMHSDIGSSTQKNEPQIQQDMISALLNRRERLRDELETLDAKAKALQQEYSHKLEEIQASKKPVEEALNHVDALLRFEGYFLNSNQAQNSTGEAEAARVEMSITDAAFRLLEELHKPIHYRDIALKLQERNIYIPGKNPAATLLSRINRDKRFKRAASRGVYGLSTWRIRSQSKKRAKSRRPKVRRLKVR